MKKIIISILIFIFPITAFSQERLRIAVMPFSAGSGVSKPEANYLTDRVRTGLIKTGKFDVISNDQIQAMMKTKQTKQEVGAGSCTSEKCIIDLGNALECEKMIVGSAAGAFKEFAISIKMLDVVKQKYDLAEEITLKSKDQFPDAAREIIKMLANKQSKSSISFSDKKDDTSVVSGPVTYTGLLWRSLLIPGWGHIYSDQTRGYAYGGLFVITGGLFLWSQLDYSSKQSAYSDAKPGANFDQLHTDANNAHKFLGLMSWAFLATYVVVLGDAFIFGGSNVATSSAMMSRVQKKEPYSFNIYAGTKLETENPYRILKDDRIDLIMNLRF
jgi:hypothetical protein